MKLSGIIQFFRKIDTNYDYKISAGEILPCGKAAMRFRAVSNFLFYGCSFSEYFGYEFYNKTRREKQTYMTRRYMFPFFDKYNPEQYRSRVGNKSQAAKYYGEYMNHDQFYYSQGRAAFEDFCQKHPRIFVKRAVGWGGEGARIEEVDSEDRRNKVWEALSQDYIAEPVIENCAELKRLHPMSLNTVNVVVLVVQGKPEVQCAMLRMGNSTVTDNIHLGGLGAGISIENGTVITPGSNRLFKKYDRHPITGEQIVGFTIPFWKETLELARNAAMVTPELKYVSWDIAITENGPVLIEGNWDAEFYMKQILCGRGFRKLFTEKLEK